MPLALPALCGRKQTRKTIRKMNNETMAVTSNIATNLLEGRGARIEITVHNQASEGRKGNIRGMFVVEGQMRYIIELEPLGSDVVGVLVEAWDTQFLLLRCPTPSLWDRIKAFFGYSNIRFSAIGLPPGITINRSTGKIKGIAKEGVYSVRIVASSAHE